MPGAPSSKLKRVIEKVIRESQLEKKNAEGREQHATKNASDDARKMV